MADGRQATVGAVAAPAGADPERGEGQPALRPTTSRPSSRNVIKLLDGLSNNLRRGRYPDDAHAGKIAAVLRAVADDLDV